MPVADPIPVVQPKTPYRLGRIFAWLRIGNRAVRSELDCTRDAIRTAFENDGVIDRDELPEILLHLEASRVELSDVGGVLNLLDEDNFAEAQAEVDFKEGQERIRENKRRKKEKV